MYYYQYTSVEYLKYNDVSNNFIDSTCLICLDNDDYDITNKILTINQYSLHKNIIKKCLCNSLFHKNCLDLWFNTKKCCPICRTEITDNSQEQLSRSASYQWEEIFVIESDPDRNNLYSTRALSFIIFITSINVFYIIMYVILTNSI